MGTILQEWQREARRLAGACDGLRRQDERLRRALRAFVDYYDRAGMPDEITAAMIRDGDEQGGFDGDECFNVRQGRRALAYRPRVVAESGAIEEEA